MNDIRSIYSEDQDPLRLKNIPVEKLIELYNQKNDPEILAVIVERNRELAHKIAGKFKNISSETRDILQVAYTGLLVAINRYDTKSNNKFSTFAYYCIEGEIQHYVRDNKLIKIPRWLWKLNRLFNEFIIRFESENFRYPTRQEISVGMNLSIDGIDEILKAREAAFYNFSLDDNPDTFSTNNISFDKKLIKSRSYKSFDLVMEDKIILWDAIDKLKGSSKKILILKYVFGFSQEEIGKKMGISQKSVSRKLRDSIKNLKNYFTQAIYVIF
ncbi:MAG: sigma-70 family RNA polymerase sigma factor [Candidatus Humimicrobiaceae bacterium]